MGLYGTILGFVFTLISLNTSFPPGVDPSAATISNMAISLITLMYGFLAAASFYLIQKFYEMKRNKSFQTNINISTEKIPRLEIAKAFYQRNNDLDIFDFSNPSTSTIYGYELGFKISEGMIMVYRNKITHQEVDGEVIAVPIMQIETQMKF
mgnify:CR=1 FL=1